MRIEFLLAVANAKTSVSRRLVLAQDQCTIGRQDGDLRLSDTLISRMHALIYFDERSQLRVKDLESTNGTWVNDQRITDQLLHKGDEIRVGDTSIVLVQAEPHQGRETPTFTESEPPSESEDRPTENHPSLRSPEAAGIKGLSYIRADGSKGNSARPMTKLNELKNDEE